MPNKKRGVILLSINAHKWQGVLIITICGAIHFGCNGGAVEKAQNEDIERQIIEDGNACIENGDYYRANEIYSQFIQEFPYHPYADDAAYRIAYMAVIADDNNPYFNYGNAEILFQNFIENYPNSRYIIACTNWLELLSKVSEKSQSDINANIEKDTQMKLISQLKNQLSALQKENTQLKKTLEELQRAIER